MENATELEELFLASNDSIVDYSVISKFTKLKRLTFTCIKNGINTLNLLDGNNQAFTSTLECLEVSDNKSITKLVGLNKYYTLTSLIIYSTGVSDVTGLSNNIRKMV